MQKSGSLEFLIKNLNILYQPKKNFCHRLTETYKLNMSSTRICVRRKIDLIKTKEFYRSIKPKTITMLR